MQAGGGETRGGNPAQARASFPCLNGKPKRAAAFGAVVKCLVSTASPRWSGARRPAERKAGDRLHAAPLAAASGRGVAVAVGSRGCFM
jgi:hypothetical protein